MQSYGLVDGLCSNSVERSILSQPRWSPVSINSSTLLRRGVTESCHLTILSSSSYISLNISHLFGFQSAQSSPCLPRIEIQEKLSGRLLSKDCQQSDVQVEVEGREVQVRFQFGHLKAAGFTLHYSFKDERYMYTGLSVKNFLKFLILKIRNLSIQCGNRTPVSKGTKPQSTRPILPVTSCLMRSDFKGLVLPWTVERSAHSTAPIVNNRRITFMTSRRIIKYMICFLPYRGRPACCLGQRAHLGGVGRVNCGLVDLGHCDSGRLLLLHLPTQRRRLFLFLFPLALILIIQAPQWTHFIYRDETMEYFCCSTRECIVIVNRRLLLAAPPRPSIFPTTLFSRSTKVYVSMATHGDAVAEVGSRTNYDSCMAQNAMFYHSFFSNRQKTFLLFSAMCVHSVCTVYTITHIDACATKPDFDFMV
ncbi:hypothetical protein CAPTEDRAFT_208651 [Capitella teleta]|uniref:CUB domain-containing protein n=1 Tax=Capitella teleta TaxID=283909 RepID=R7TZZ7_CAPTE|nr:hypothetical protein CAPTEDRAFT_208651 [Capitella teleta]|eukprot:ELT99294.1 hypothetical protein CAPTEDRAFT_208651 [Capitella teleta]